MTPSAIAVCTRCTGASGEWLPGSPLACLVLQYVHCPRHRWRGQISTCSFLRTRQVERRQGFFSSNRGVARERALHHVHDAIDLSHADGDKSSSSFASYRPRGRIAMTNFFPCAFPLVMTVFIAL